MSKPCEFCQNFHPFLVKGCTYAVDAGSTYPETAGGWYQEEITRIRRSISSRNQREELTDLRILELNYRERNRRK